MSHPNSTADTIPVSSVSPAVRAIVTLVVPTVTSLDDEKPHSFEVVWIQTKNGAGTRGMTSLVEVMVGPTGTRSSRSFGYELV